MKWLLIISLLFTFVFAHAQQYGWVRVAQLGTQSTNLQAVEFVDSLHGWLYGSGVNYMYTLDGGTNWTQAVSAGFGATSISMMDTLHGWTAGNGFNEGGIGKTTDGGRSWIQQRLRFDRGYSAIASLSVSKSIASGSTYNFFPDTGKILQTTNGGTTWTERTIADSIYRLGKIQFVDSLHGWIAAGVRGQPGGVLRTTDGGMLWALSITSFFQGISFIDKLRGWGITPGRSLFKTTNGGIDWQFLGGVGSQNEDFSAAAISFVDSSNGWAFGLIFYQGDLAAAIYRTTDGGLSWSRELAGGGSRGVTGMMLDRYHGWAVGTAGSVFAYRLVSGVPERINGVPKAFALKQNYPNPFNPTTTIEYAIIKQSVVSIKVYDANGREVKEVVNTEQAPGVYRIQFDGTNLASGVYYYTLRTKEFEETKQMSFVK